MYPPVSISEAGCKKNYSDSYQCKIGVEKIYYMFTKLLSATSTINTINKSLVQIAYHLFIT